MCTSQGTVVQGTYRRMVLAALFMVLWGRSAMSFAAHLQFATHSGAPAMPHDFSATRYFNAALYSISQTLLTQQLAAVRASPYFSLLADSSTDVGTEDHLLLYVRYLEPSSFIYHTSFLGAVKVVGATSEHITAVILRVIDILSLDVGKLEAFCSDGASTFMGAHNGVIAKLQQQHVSYMVDQRFPSSILNSFAIFVPRSYVGMVAAELVVYGQQELQELVKHFCNASQRQQLFRVEGTAGVARLVQQLTFFKRQMWRVVQANRSVILQSAWVQLMEVGYVHFPLMMQLAQVMLLVPLQTAVVERGFSIHRIIKHRLTNRLKLAIVDSHMRIRLIGPSKHSYQKEEALIAHAASAMDEILKLKAAGKPEGILAALSEAALPLEVEQPNVPLDLEGDMEEVESLWGEESEQEECEHESSDEVDEALFGTEAGGVPEDTFEASLLAAVS
ncbi:hypothetical protein QJQ45_030423 [Haematococcus lacustris]|nr:hypothetical protein QJQ45_030423 [Haematococcus lacustris]